MTRSIIGACMIALPFIGFAYSQGGLLPFLCICAVVCWIAYGVYLLTES